MNERACRAAARRPCIRPHRGDNLHRLRESGALKTSASQQSGYIRRSGLAAQPVVSPKHSERISTMSIIITLVIGLIAGFVARAIKPGDDNMGIIMTAAARRGRLVHRQLWRRSAGSVRTRCPRRLHRLGGRRGHFVVRGRVHQEAPGLIAPLSLATRKRCADKARLVTTPGFFTFGRCGILRLRT